MAKDDFVRWEIRFLSISAAKPNAKARTLDCIPWKKLFDLKKRWKVSVAAILRRAVDLKIMTPIQYRNGCIYLSRTGQTKEELYDKDIPSERPEVMQEALELLDSVGEIRHYLKETGMSSEFFEKLSGFTLSHINNIVSINQFR